MVGAGKSFCVLALVGQIARFRDDKGAAAKADNGPGRKRYRLVGAVASAGIAAEYGRLKCPLLGGRDADAKAGSGKRVGRSAGGEIGGKKRRANDGGVDGSDRRFGLAETAIP